MAAPAIIDRVANEWRASVARQTLTIGESTWSFFDSSARPPSAAPDAVPLVCLPGLIGGGKQFARTCVALSSFHARVICVEPPPSWSHTEWVVQMKTFLDTIGVRSAHFLGLDLGGFLALKLAEFMPAYVLSVVLCNSFADTSVFAARSAACTALFAYMPPFILKKIVLEHFPRDALEVRITASVDAAARELDEMDGDAIGSRLTLLCSPGHVGRLELAETSITVISTPDAGELLQLAHAQLIRRFPQARQAHLKDGGSWPHCSRADQVSLMTAVHLRRHGASSHEQYGASGADEEGGS